MKTLFISTRPHVFHKLLEFVQRSVMSRYYHEQNFSEVAPTGAIMNKAFVELLAETAALTYGLDILPDLWLSVSYSQVKRPLYLLFLAFTYFIKSHL